MKIVIRAGGVGARLWPMSRKSNPKQFQNVIGTKSMLRTTYERIAPILSQDNDLFVSVNVKFKEKVKKEIPEINPKNIILETETRNTGPAMCLEASYLEKFCNPKEIIASLPSDDYISDNQAFQNLLITSEDFILNNPEYILTPAVIPEYPDTGYTYFKAGKNLRQNGEEAIYAVADVAEKPNEDYCRELLKSGIYYSHTGMYLWELGNINRLWEQHQPIMHKICQQTVDLAIKGKSLGKIKDLYGQLEKVTVETALTNKIDKIGMSVSNRIGWSDLGKWHIIKKILSSEVKENLTKGKIIIKDSKNNLVYGKNKNKIIVINDIEGLAIIDTDDVLFISSLKNSAEVKKIVAKLKKSNLEKYT